MVTSDFDPDLLDDSDGVHLRIDNWLALSINRARKSLTVSLGEMFSYDTVEALRAFGQHVEVDGEGPDRAIALNVDDFDCFDSLMLDYDDYRLVGYTTVLPFKTPEGVVSGNEAGLAITLLGPPEHFVREDGTKSSTDESQLNKYLCTSMTPGVLVYRLSPAACDLKVLIGLYKERVRALTVIGPAWS